MTATDTSRTLEIHHSPVKLAAFLVLSIFMTGVGVFVAMADDGQLAFGAGAAVFFGLCTVLLAWRLFAARGLAVVLSPEGICDLRISTSMVPWTAIRDIRTWEYQGQKIMVLALDPAFENTLAWTSSARWTRPLNRWAGADGYCIATTGLKTSYDALLAATTAYTKAARRA